MDSVSAIEQSILDHLAPLRTSERVVRLMPESPALIGKPAEPEVITLYLESSVPQTQPVFGSSFAQTLTFGVDVRVLTKTALAQLRDSLWAYLNGFKPTGALKPLVLGGWKFEGARDNRWVATLTLKIDAPMPSDKSKAIPSLSELPQVTDVTPIGEILNAEI